MTDTNQTTPTPTKGNDMNKTVMAAIDTAKNLISDDFIPETLRSLDGFGHSMNDQRGTTLQDVADGNEYVIEAMEKTGLMTEDGPLDIKVAEQIITALDEWLVAYGTQQGGRVR